jgi:hypothetical protein
VLRGLLSRGTGGDERGRRVQSGSSPTASVKV